MLRALSIMLTLAASVHAGQWLGLGVMAGEPTGLSAKTWLGKTTAVDAGLAWSLSGDKDLQAHADYLIHNSELLDGLGLIALGEASGDQFGRRALVNGQNIARTVRGLLHDERLNDANGGHGWKSARGVSPPSGVGSGQ